LSTVTIQKRKRKHNTTYPVYFKNPFNHRKEYFRTFPKLKEAQIAANELRALLNAGKLPTKKKLILNPLTFKKVGDSLKTTWRTKLRRGELKEKTYTDYCYWLEGLNRIRKAWKNTLKEAGITGFHFHDLRHTFASNMLLAGASLKDVKEMIGHSDISMTDRYSHLTVTHKTKIQDQLADHYLKGATFNPSGGHIGVTESKSHKKSTEESLLSA